MGAELEFLDFIQENLRTNTGDVVMSIITHMMDYCLVWLIITGILLIFESTRKIGIAILFALILTEIIGNGVIKTLIDRPRPFEENIDIILLIQSPITSSFPSVHTATSVAAAFALFFFNKKMACVGMIFAALVAFSRMYLYVHYPTDILGGIILGLICGYLGYTIAEWLCKKYGKGGHKSFCEQNI